MRTALWVSFAALFLTVLAGPSAWPQTATIPVSVTALVQYPDRYSGEIVEVTGTVTGYRERVALSGVPYTFFRLRDGRVSVAVYAWPHLGLHDGLRVHVMGHFEKVKTYLFINARRTVVVR